MTADYQAHNNASDLSDPRNAPDYTGTYCRNCGDTFQSPGGERNFEDCYEHFFLSDPEIQREIFGELLVELSRLKSANLKLFIEKGELEGKLRLARQTFDETSAMAERALGRLAK